LDVRSIDVDSALLLHLSVFISPQRCKPPVLADNDLLSPGKFVRRATESLNGDGAIRIASSYREKDLTNIDSSNSSIWFSPSTAHAGLESICTSNWQHLVDSDHVVRVSANPKMEAFLASMLNEISEIVSRSQIGMEAAGPLEVVDLLVGTDATSFESFWTQLLVFVGDHMDAKRKLIGVRSLSSKIEDADLGIGNATIEPRFGKRLQTIV
jgi:hypothetical protein